MKRKSSPVYCYSWSYSCMSLPVSDPFPHTTANKAFRVEVVEPSWRRLFRCITNLRSISSSSNNGNNSSKFLKSDTLKMQWHCYSLYVFSNSKVPDSCPASSICKFTDRTLGLYVSYLYINPSSFFVLRDHDFLRPWLVFRLWETNIYCPPQIFQLASDQHYIPRCFASHTPVYRKTCHLGIPGANSKRRYVSILL